MKYCKDCKFFDWSGATSECKAVFDENEGPVHGIVRNYSYCHIARGDSGQCGPEAKLFEPKAKMDFVD